MSAPAQPAALLQVDIQHRIGTLALDIQFEIRRPWTLLFGPSGSGKTTILRAISGLLRPERGSIALRLPELLIVFDQHAGIFLPPHRRPVRAATQTARLFPNLTVRGNLLYAAGSPPHSTEHLALADELLALFRIDSLAACSPRQLSGGEQQRASVARAVLSAALPPRSLLLLDEPFTGLDTPVRDVLLADLQTWLATRRIPVLSVSHDIAEAFQLSAEVIRLHDGRVLQQGPAAIVLAEERTRLLGQLDPIRHSVPEKPSS